MKSIFTVLTLATAVDNMKCQSVALFKPRINRALVVNKFYDTFVSKDAINVSECMNNVNDRHDVTIYNLVLEEYILTRVSNLESNKPRDCFFSPSTDCMQIRSTYRSQPKLSKDFSRLQLRNGDFLLNQTWINMATKKDQPMCSVATSRHGLQRS